MPYDPPLVTVEEARSVLREALRRGGEWAEVMSERRDHHAVRLDGGSVADVRGDRDLGAAVRVMSGGRTGLASTNVLDRAGLLEVARAATAATMTAGPTGTGVGALD